MREQDLPRPERTDIRQAQLRKRARRALNAAGVKVGGDHLIPPIVEAITVELEALRERCAAMVLMLEERGVQMVNPHQGEDDNPMLSLALALRCHFVDHEGNIQMFTPSDDDEEG